jgi:hypothetical protein
VRYTGRCMNMRDLNRCRKNQQQSTANGKHQLPPVLHVIVGLLIAHYSNYNVPLLWRQDRRVRVVKENSTAQHSHS